jgi:hypothetical protein
MLLSLVFATYTARFNTNKAASSIICSVVYSNETNTILVVTTLLKWLPVSLVLTTIIRPSNIIKTIIIGVVRDFLVNT